MIILLNGASSSGKSTIVEALNLLSPKPFLQLGIDNLYTIMPRNYINLGPSATHGFGLIKSNSDKELPVTVKFGNYGSKVRNCYASAAKVFADQGLDLIIDEVLLGDQFLHSYAKALANELVYFVGINCDLKVLQEREMLRQNREVGLAKGQLHQIHSPERFYDLMLDSSLTSPFDNAQLILNFMANNPLPTGFAKCCQRLAASN